MLCRVNDVIEIVEHVIQLCGLLFVLEAEGPLALESHLCYNPECAQGAYCCVEDVRLFRLGARDRLSSRRDQCQLQYLDVQLAFQPIK